MAYRITFVLELFNGPEQQELSHRVLQILLDSLYATNVEWLKANPNAPRIYDKDVVTHKARIHYEQEPAGQEDWQDIPTTLRLGEGDCEDLACWRAAELTVRDNIHATPTFTFKPRKNGGMLYHILVKHPDGHIEDPSRQLGMK
jgi:hypothetical protein